ncbi:hypothetical protein JAAARDRAFT_51002 [Jaapia argillacea MUCL 33604]|uniref:Uncharacterized protein n=1 Tax=Jaapia argillacea MUCL 33604 TaxID=933084 RepID=A0A067PIY9_9AGAM|nr:hypothetical protein JAAARDRAFT_51002 [Jaapia argillacea MUCL 33604]
MVSTRAKNANTHPGVPDMRRPRRTSAQVAADTKVKLDAKKAGEDKYASRIKEVAEVETTMEVEDQDRRRRASTRQPHGECRDLSIVVVRQPRSSLVPVRPSAIPSMGVSTGERQTVSQAAINMKAVATKASRGNPPASPEPTVHNEAMHLAEWSENEMPEDIETSCGPPSSINDQDFHLSEDADSEGARTDSEQFSACAEERLESPGSDTEFQEELLAPVEPVEEKLSVKLATQTCSAIVIAPVKPKKIVLAKPTIRESVKTAKDQIASKPDVVKQAPVDMGKKREAEGSLDRKPKKAKVITRSLTKNWNASVPTQKPPQTVQTIQDPDAPQYGGLEDDKPEEVAAERSKARATLQKGRRVQVDMGKPSRQLGKPTVKPKPEKSKRPTTSDLGIMSKEWAALVIPTYLAFIGSQENPFNLTNVDTNGELSDICEEVFPTMVIETGPKSDAYHLAQGRKSDLINLMSKMALKLIEEIWDTDDLFADSAECLWHIRWLLGEVVAQTSEDEDSGDGADDQKPEIAPGEQTIPFVWENYQNKKGLFCHPLILATVGVFLAKARDTIWAYRNIQGALLISILVVERALHLWKNSEGEYLTLPLPAFSEANCHESIKIWATSVAGLMGSRWKKLVDAACEPLDGFAKHSETVEEAILDPRANLVEADSD